MDEDYGCEDYCDDLNEWETEQVFQDHEGREPDESGDFGIRTASGAEVPGPSRIGGRR
jgi:hypothetical protein